MLVNISFSESKRVCRIHDADTGNLIAELLIHGFLSRAVDMGREHGKYIFRGEVTQLAGFEFLNIEQECITEYKQS